MVFCGKVRGTGSQKGRRLRLGLGMLVVVLNTVRSVLEASARILGSWHSG